MLNRNLFHSYKYFFEAIESNKKNKITYFNCQWYNYSDIVLLRIQIKHENQWMIANLVKFNKCYLPWYIDIHIIFHV